MFVWPIVVYLLALNAQDARYSWTFPREGCHFTKTSRMLGGYPVGGWFLKRSKDVFCWQRSTLTDPQP